MEQNNRKLFFNELIEYPNNKRIDYDIIESNRPKLYKQVTDFKMCVHEYTAEILKQSEDYNIDKDGIITNVNFTNGIKINQNIDNFSQNIIKSCDSLEKLI